MTKVAIIDDEKNIRAYLVSLIKEQDINCDITEYGSTDEYIAAAIEYDLVLLDIQMQTSVSGIDGMSLARYIRRQVSIKQPIIIFITGYEEFVYDAFDVGAFHYLIKPVNAIKFAEIFSRALGQIRSCEEKQKKALIVKFSNSTMAIQLHKIYYMESANHKVVIHMEDGEIEYYAKIRDIEEELQGQFYRIHKGYLINLEYVDEYSKKEVTMLNGDKLLISKYKYDLFVKAYLSYLQ